MGLPIADHWFERKRIDDEITLLWEPHVDPLVRCNIWHVRGRDRDALIDSGLGIASLKAAADDLFEKEVVAVATHIHYDHVGSLHEFDTRVMHRIEAPKMVDYKEFASLYGSDLAGDLAEVAAEGDSEFGDYEIPDVLVIDVQVLPVLRQPALVAIAEQRVGRPRDAEHVLLVGHGEGHP